MNWGEGAPADLVVLLLIGLTGWLLIRDDGQGDDCGGCQVALSRAADWIEGEGGDFGEIVD